jgi:chemotaxis methyl-accepting protein methylase
MTLPVQGQGNGIDPNLNLQRLLEYIRRELNFDCRAYNESYIIRRLNSRILSNNLPPDDFATYLGLLKSSPTEPKKLYDALTINVTQFFRDTRLWEVLEQDVFPKVIAEKKGKINKTLSIWSCGCSSGEEPYSLAILLQEMVKNREVIPKITATDIDDLSLKRARAGIYTAQSFKSTPPEYIDRYFRRTVDAKGNETFEVNPTTKMTVQVVQHNAITQPPPACDFDMVFCRNVIIYFTQETKNRLLETFHSALAEHGWLVIGKSEVLFVAKTHNKFYVYNGAESIYRKERRAQQLPR